MKNILTTVTLLLFSATVVFAQPGTTALPENPEGNKCYVRCVSPDVYETETVRIMTKPAYKVLEIVPAKYEDREERVLVHEGYSRYEIVEAEFSNETVTYQSEEPYNKLAIVPASFSDDSETITVSPKVMRWESQPYAGCQSDNPLDCQVWCWREYPAQMQDVAKQVLANDASTTSTVVGGDDDTYTKRVVSRPAETREIRIEPVYENITKRVLVTNETTTETTVEAEYTEVEREVLKTKGGMETFEEIECELLEYNVLPINYETNSARLTANARSIIDERLLTLLNEKPNVKIELGSHTDARGSESANQLLSERRAQSVVNYLVGKGINSSRLVAVGHGESRLKNRCADGVPCTEKEHAVNRRTEFRILNY